jgi:Mlc titration factor MtfA (ptsG expression regulator)
LNHTRITGIGTTVTDLDKLLIATSAIIPIFNFDHWDYINLNEVLLYPDAFDENFQLDGPGRNMLGVVGTGPYQNIMILSKQQLLNGFMDKTSDKHTAIHEFVHLIDKTDGEIDGIPEMLLGKQYIIPWLQLMHKKISEIQANQSEINPYGATNQAEFFAVASEYFFQKPEMLQINHPDLFKMLSRIFSKKATDII